jgi:hypothetical protein
LDGALGHDVLEGTALSRDVDIVRSRIAWCDAILADQARSEDPHDFARRRLEVEIRELRTQINAAVPESAAVRGVNRDVISEERAQLQHSLASLTADYELITGAVDDSLELARAFADVAARHTVDTGWLTAQKDALAVLEAEDAAQLIYEQRERTTITVTSHDQAYESEPTIDRGFSMEREL